MVLDCDWSISVQLIPDRSAKICNRAKICNKVQKPATRVQKSVTRVQNFVTNLSDWITQIPTKLEIFCSK